MDPIASRMWALFDAEDYDRTFDVALRGTVILGVSLYTEPIGARIPIKQGDVLVGFDNRSGAPATVELRHVHHRGPERDETDEACILRVRVPAHGRSLAYHVGALGEVGLPGREDLVLACEREGVLAVHAVLSSEVRRALATNPDKLLPYRPMAISTVA